MAIICGEYALTCRLKSLKIAIGLGQMFLKSPESCKIA